MEQKKFIQILRKVVKEEVRSVIKEQLTEILQEGLQSTINTMATEQKKQSITETFQSTPTKKKKIEFKENKFADILNETDLLRENRTSSDYAKLMTEDIVMTSADAQGFGVQRTINAAQQAVVTDVETGETLQADPVTAKAMTRDYSALMKAIDKKKGRN